MKIITSTYSFFSPSNTDTDYGVFSIGKSDFLTLKMEFQNSTSVRNIEAVIKFMEENTKLDKVEIQRLAKFFITSDFRIEE